MPMFSYLRMQKLDLKFIRRLLFYLALLSGLTLYFGYLFGDGQQKGANKARSDDIKALMEQLAKLEMRQ
jgi:hypothetical protein